MIKNATKFMFLALFLYAFVGTNAVVGQEQSEIVLTGLLGDWGDQVPLYKFGNGYLYVITQLNTDDVQEFKFRTNDENGGWDNNWGRDEQIIGFQESLEVWSNGGDMELKPSSGKYYIFTMQEPVEYGVNTFIMVQETSARPVTIDEVTQSPLANDVMYGQEVTVTATLSAAPSQEEIFYVRYSSDGWNNSTVIDMTVNDDVATADIPAQGDKTVSYYVFSTTVGNINADYDLATIHLKNAGDGNFEYSAASWETIADGDWDDADTWNLGFVPPKDISIGNVTINHEVTSNQDAIINELNIGEDGTVEFSDDTEVIISGGNFADNAAEFYDLTIKGGVHFGENATINNSLTIEGGYLRIAEDGTGISDEKYIPDYKEGATLIYAGDFEYEEENFAGAFGENASKRPTNLVIKEGKTVELNEPDRKVAGTLTVEAGATLETGKKLFLLTDSHLDNQGTINGGITFQKTIDGAQGWRMLSTPTNQSGEDPRTFAHYLHEHSGLWTQGFDEAETEAGESNVQIHKATGFESITNINDALPKGEGFITYVFEVDDYGKQSGEFPKTLNIFGELNSGDVTVPLHEGDDGFVLLGNPYAFTLDWDALKTDNGDVKNVVYTYDSANTTYVDYNGTIGGFEDGEIPSFQGFWVERANEDEEATFTFKESAAVKGNTELYKEQSQSASFKLIAEMDGMKDHNYFSFTENGSINRDNQDALKLSPLDFVSHLSMATQVGEELMSINNLPVNLDKDVEFDLIINAFEATNDGYALKAGEVTLSASDFKNMPETWDIFVNNYQNGEKVNLREVEEYKFMLHPKQKIIKPEGPLSILHPVNPVRAKAVEQSGISITIATNTPTSIDNATELPQQFALEQNYPNPFNPTTNIKFSLPNTGEVSLVVYNVMGQKVAELIKGTKQAGTYTAQWDAKNAASGIYFYKLSSEGQTITRRMTLIK